MDRRANEQARPWSAPDVRDSETRPELDEGASTMSDVERRTRREMSEGSWSPERSRKGADRESAARLREDSQSAQETWAAQTCNAL